MTASVLVELGALMRSVPSPDAPATTVAAWYAGKARLLEHAAGEESGGELAAVWTIEAGRARRRAARLLGQVA